MKNKISKSHNLDSSYESFKNTLKRNNLLKNKFEKKINCNNNYKDIYRNKIILNNCNYTNKDRNDYTNKKFINFVQNKNNNMSKEKLNKPKNTQIKNYCNTPDRNFKYNLGLTPNKNNISLVKLNNRNYRNSFQNNHNKMEPKFVLNTRKKNYNIISNQRKMALTPDKVRRSNLGNIKKIKESESSNYFNFKNFNNNFSKSYQDSNQQNKKDNSYDYNFFDDSSLRYNKIKEKNKRKTPDKLIRKIPNLNYKYNNKINYKLSNHTKFPILNNTSQMKFSNSFYSNNTRNERKSYDLRTTNEKNYILSNSQINSNKKPFIHKQNYKVLLRSKSSNYNCVKRNNFKSNEKQRKNSKYKKFCNNNNSNFTNSSKEYNKNKNQDLIKHTFNDFNSSQKLKDFNFSTNYENYHVNKSELTFSQKKANKDLGKYDYSYNFNNTNSNMFNEKTQMNNTKIQQNKKYKFIGINNYMTKSSTNTYDEINSSNSNISKNTILDSIEEIHFNFVNVVQSSRNLIKMENKSGDKIIDNNPNSSVILVEERDIE